MAFVVPSLSRLHMTRLQKIQQMLAEQPDDAFLMYALAMEHRAAGNDPLALETLDRVLSHDADYVSAYFQQGQIHAALGQIPAAAAALRLGISVAERVGDAHAAREMMDFLEGLE